MGNDTSKPTREPDNTALLTHTPLAPANGLVPSTTVSEKHPTSDNNNQSATSNGTHTVEKLPVDLPPADLQLARYTRSGRIGSIQSPSNGEPRMWMLQEALDHYNPYVGNGSGFFCVAHHKEVANETKRVLLAVNEGERPSTASELQEATIFRRSWSKRYDYWSLDQDGWRYILSSDSFDDIGPCWWRWGGFQKGLDRPMAFPIETAAAREDWGSTDDEQDSRSVSPNRRTESTQKSGAVIEPIGGRTIPTDDETEDLYVSRYQQRSARRVVESVSLTDTSDDSSSNQAHGEIITNMTRVVPARNHRGKGTGPGKEVQVRRRIRSSARNIEIDEIKARKYQKRADAGKYEEKANGQEIMVAEQESSIKRKEEEASRLREEESRILRELESVQTKAETIEAEISRQKADARRQREEFSINRALALKAQVEYEKTEEQLAALKAAGRGS
ncbi:MAG: hypothetical protein Q9213_008133 [Squamulea squamosa]